MRSHSLCSMSREPKLAKMIIGLSFAILFCIADAEIYTITVSSIGFCLATLSKMGYDIQF